MKKSTLTYAEIQGTARVRMLEYKGQLDNEDVIRLMREMYFRAVSHEYVDYEKRIQRIRLDCLKMENELTVARELMTGDPWHDIRHDTRIEHPQSDGDKNKPEHDDNTASDEPARDS